VKVINFKDPNALRKVDLSIEFCGLKLQNQFLLVLCRLLREGEMIKRAFDAGWEGQ
jgi:hypothetical protein